LFTRDPTLIDLRLNLACALEIATRYNVCAQLHFTVVKEMRIRLGKEHWYEHVPKSVEISNYNSSMK